MNAQHNIKTELKENCSSGSQVPHPSIGVNHPTVNALIRALAKQAAREYLRGIQAANDNTTSPQGLSEYVSS